MDENSGFALIENKLSQQEAPERPYGGLLEKDGISDFAMILYQALLLSICVLRET